MTSEPWKTIARAVSEATGTAFEPDSQTPAGGGFINRVTVLEGGGRRFFVKLNSEDRLAMFEAEAEGLAEMAATGTVRVPDPVCRGTAGGQAYLVLEYLELGGITDRHAERLGRQLAAMHRHQSDRFGWYRDNTLGTTPQPNEWHADWIEFLREQRLGHQFRLLDDKALSGKWAGLSPKLPAFFDDYTPRPSLIHGDLWGGNWSGLADGEPVVFDPATYYGDREMEMAMTELFGGFPESFYTAYNETWPLDAGYERRQIDDRRLHFASNDRAV
jgi:fructosamine-3-kinase